MDLKMKHVVIVGGGFAGLTAAKTLGSKKDIRVTLIDKQNFHLFQPLLYQVAMAGLSPADIAAPIRSLLSKHENVRVLRGVVARVNTSDNSIDTDIGSFSFDYLIMAAGAKPFYFNHPEWEEYAPSIKTISQATEIRRRLLNAFEKAERTDDTKEQKKLLTFVVIGGGPTGVELAGAIGEMSRYTLARDFRNIDASVARIFLIEGGAQILPMFSVQHAKRAARDLEKLGVQIWTNSLVSDIDEDGVTVGSERISSSTVLWAAGVQGETMQFGEDVGRDQGNRIMVESDLSIPGFQNVFVVGDQSNIDDGSKDLPGTAPVAMQQGRFAANTILNDLAQKTRSPFKFTDRGQMATIGRSSAIVEVGKLKFAGLFAWITWLVVHIYFLVGFKNRLMVVFSWGWSFLTFRKGARLIVDRDWRIGGETDSPSQS
jgi:NADH dehydrogenase